MNPQVILVWINAVVFFLYGIGFVFFPETLAQRVTDTMPATPSGLVDLRATYGGMSAGLGLLLAVLAGNIGTVRTGLLGVLIIMLGMAGARLLGMITEAPVNTTMYAYLAAELVMASLAAGALITSRRATPDVDA